MCIARCKLKKNIQKKLLEFFIPGVTARSAASLPGIQGNSAILFHQKIRQVINWHLVRESEEMFDGSAEPDSIVCTDSWKAYNALDANQFRHKRINHSACPLFLKEREFGFNYSTPKKQLKTLSAWCGF